MSNRDIARAVALGQSDSANSMYRALSDEEAAAYHEYLTVVFAVMLAARLEDDSSREAVDQFLNEVKSGYRSLGDQLKPLALEATVRATLGEEELIREVSAGDQMAVQMLCVRLITATVPKVGDNLEQYLSDAEALAAAELG